LVRLYGTRAWVLLGTAASLTDLGEHFGWDLYAAEVRYLIAQEWAMTAQDVLWRRTKVGLHVTDAQADALETFMAKTVQRRSDTAPQ
ncbi:glycerol-3-phosphate dehydrogenase C-terminal domain-containing protein, partial [Phyllobacterium sp.]|nr:glycerol-3-phosphate dehydrogenase [Phyllobacterium sp.]